MTTKVAVWCAALASIALLVYSAVLLVVHEHAETASLDIALRDEVNHFFQEFGRHDLDLAWITQRQVEEIMSTARDPRQYCEIAGRDARVLVKSKSLRGQSLGQLAEGSAWIRLGGKKVRTFSQSENGLTVKVASDLHVAEMEAAELVSMMTYSLPVVLVFIGVGAWAVARRALRPIRAMAAAAEGITPRHMSVRLPGADGGDEIGRLSRAFNGMLDRIQGNLRQVNRFSADASHELKTPISVIKAGLGDLMHSRNLSEKDQEAVVELQEQVGRVTAIMDSLLLLSRVDAGHLTISMKPVDVAEMVRELVEDFDMLGASASVRLHLSVDRAVSVKADEHMLRQVLVNLLDNAMKYNFPGGSIRLEIGVEGSQGVIRVANTGPGIALEHRERVFERFYRIAHTSEVSGTGLGLCISREIARALGGELALGESKDGWTEFELSLPLAPVTARSKAST